MTVLRAMTCFLAGAALCACKTDDAKPAPPPPAKPAPPRPAPPAPRAPAATAAELAFPAFRDARELAPPRATPQLDALVASWCLSGSIAAATQQLAAALTAGGFDHVAARGTGERRAISGMRGDDRVSISVGGKDQRCDGIVATGTIVRAGSFTPPALEPGERIR